MTTISKFKLDHLKQLSLPITPQGIPSAKEEHEAPLSKSDHELYRSMLGSLGYLVTGTRPDLAFPVSVFGLFQADPVQRHIEELIRVYRYLKGTTNYSILYKNDVNCATLQLTTYSDASWGNCPSTARSWSGMLATLNGAPICWSSKRQRSVALSTMESEYMALSDAALQHIWLKRVLDSLCPPSKSTNEVVRLDNTAAKTTAETAEMSKKAKHIKMRYHSVKDLVKEKAITLEYVPSKENLADIGTKPLGGNDLLRLCNQLFTLNIDESIFSPNVVPMSKDVSTEASSD